MRLQLLSEIIVDLYDQYNEQCTHLAIICKEGEYCVNNEFLVDPDELPQSVFRLILTVQVAEVLHDVRVVEVVFLGVEVQKDQHKPRQSHHINNEERHNEIERVLSILFIIAVVCELLQDERRVDNLSTIEQSNHASNEVWCEIRE